MSPEALVPTRTRAPALRADPPPSPIEKAAMILTAVGPDLAGGFLRALGEADMERFAHAVAGLGRIRQEVLDAVIVEFLEALTSGPELTGGAKAARKLLGSVLDEDRMARLFDGADPDRRTIWDRLNEAPVPALATFLRAERPQTAAVILREMRPETAASVLEKLDRAFAQNVVLRLARPARLDPGLIESIGAVIERDFLAVLRSDLGRRRPADLIAGLMNNISVEARDGFIGYLEAQEPGLARDVQRTMFTFEDIATRLNARDIAGILRDLSEESLLRALSHGQATGSVTPAFVLDSLPRRLADRYAEELAALDPVDRATGEAAQMDLTRAIQSQVRLGLLRLTDADPGVT